MASSSKRLDVRIREINERQPTAALTSRGLLVSEATERRWTRLSLDFCCLEARTERPARPLSVAALLKEVATLGGRGTWGGVRGGITAGTEVTSTLDGRRVSEGDGEGDGEDTVAGLTVDAEMSATEDGTDGGG